MDYKEGWALKKWCFWTVMLEKTLKIPLDWKEIKSINPQGIQSWIFIGRTDAEAPNTFVTWCEEPTHNKRPWCWERLKVGEEGDNRERDGWMASPTQRTWVWANSARWWRTGKPGMLQSMGLQRVGHDWVNKQKSINVVSVLTLIPSNFSPISLLLGPPYSLRPADIPTMTSCSTERKKSHISHFK